MIPVLYVIIMSKLNCFSNSLRSFSHNFILTVEPRVDSSGNRALESSPNVGGTLGTTHSR